MKAYRLLVVIFFVCALSCIKKKERKASLLALNTHDSLILNNLLTYIDSCWNKNDTTFLSDISTENFTRNLNGVLVASTKREMQAHMNVFFNAFPDMEVKLEEPHIKNNTAFFQWTSSGTHTGTFGQVRATGKKVKINGLSSLHFNSDGKLYQEDVAYNELGLLQQLGYTLNPPILD